MVCLNCRLLFGGCGGGGRLPPSATPPPNAPLNSQLPNAVNVAYCDFFRPPAVLCAAAAAAAHRNCAAGWPLPSLYPIAIMLPAAPACCRTHAAAAACYRMHAASAARCRTHAGCMPSIAIIPPAAAACCCTYARCSLPHPRRRCCILLHACRFHHCSRLHCRLHRCWCHVH